MSEYVPVHMTSRGEYDLFSQDRVKTQKLSRGVLYILMLEVEGDSRRAGRVTVELPRVPVFATESPDASAAVDVMFKDDDAQSVFQLSGTMRLDQLYLAPTRLQLVGDGAIMKEGYFLTNEEEVQMAMQLHVLVGAGGNDTGITS